MFSLVLRNSLQEPFLCIKAESQILFTLLFLRKFCKCFRGFWQTPKPVGFHRLQHFGRQKVGIILELITVRLLQGESGAVADLDLVGNRQLQIHWDLVWH